MSVTIEQLIRSEEASISSLSNCKSIYQSSSNLDDQLDQAAEALQIFKLLQDANITKEDLEVFSNYLINWNLSVDGFLKEWEELCKVKEQAHHLQAQLDLEIKGEKEND